MSAKKSFQELIQDDNPVLIDFSAEWCGPCKMMEPILKEVKNNVGADAKILKIDVDKNPILAGQFKVQSVPTLVLFSNGSPVWRHSGVIQATQLIRILRET